MSAPSIPSMYGSAVYISGCRRLSDGLAGGFNINLPCPESPPLIPAHKIIMFIGNLISRF